MKTKLQTIEVHPANAKRMDGLVYISDIEPYKESDVLGSVRYECVMDRLILNLYNGTVAIWLPDPEVWEGKYAIATLNPENMYK